MMATIFVASTLLLVVLLGIKLVEGRRGKRYFAFVRARVDARTVDVAHALETHTSSFFRTRVRGAVLKSVHLMTVLILAGVRFIENRLVGVMRSIRGQYRPGVRKKSSAYLSKLLVDSDSRERGRV